MQIEREFGARRVIQATIIFGVMWTSILIFRLCFPERFTQSNLNSVLVIFLWLGWPSLFLSFLVEWIGKARKAVNRK